MRDVARWEALGVRPPSDVGSEMAELVLTLPPAGELGGEEPQCEGIECEAAAEPAGVGQEIFERKGWNAIDGGWRGLF